MTGSECSSVGLRGLCSDGLASSESHFLGDFDIYCYINSVDSCIKMLKIFGMGEHAEMTTSSQKPLPVCTHNSGGEKPPTQREGIFH